MGSSLLAEQFSLGLRDPPWSISRVRQKQAESEKKKSYVLDPTRLFFTFFFSPSDNLRSHISTETDPEEILQTMWKSLPEINYPLPLK